MNEPRSGPGADTGEGAAEAYLELVLDLVAQIPSGRASTYGAVADAARAATGRGSARTVGRIMGQYGSDVPWWRVVTASGAAAERVAGRALALLRAEGTPMTDHDPPRVDLAQAGWEPGFDDLPPDSPPGPPCDVSPGPPPDGPLVRRAMRPIDPASR